MDLTTAITSNLSQYMPGLILSGFIASLIKSKSIFLVSLRAVAVVGDIAGKLYKRISGQDAIKPGQSDLQAAQETAGVIFESVKVGSVKS